jgi:hypothetical protein
MRHVHSFPAPAPHPTVLSAVHGSLLCRGIHPLSLLRVFVPSHLVGCCHVAVCEQDLRSFKQMWDVMSLIIERLTTWRGEQWCNLQLSVVRTQALQLLELLDGLSESCHNTPAYQSTMSRCSALLIVIPLVKVGGVWGGSSVRPCAFR